MLTANQLKNLKFRFLVYFDHNQRSMSADTAFATFCAFERMAEYRRREFRAYLESQGVF